MKVFITGGTGFVGREIVRLAHSSGHQLRLLVRRPDAPAVAELKSFCQPELQQGDVLDSASLAHALAGIDAVIHLVGIISEVGRNTFENAHVRATENLIGAARSAGVPRFLHMSALGTRANALSRYHRTKWEAEEAVRKSGLAFTIFRPSLVYGPQDQFVNLFEHMSRISPVLPVMGSGRARFQPVSVHAVATAFVRALDESRATNQTYDLCGPQTLTLPEMLDQIMAVTGRRRWKVRIPLGVARAQAAFLEWFYPVLLRQASPLNRDQLTMLQEDNVGQGGRADELFKLKHTTFGEGIKEYVKLVWLPG